MEAMRNREICVIPEGTEISYLGAPPVVRTVCELTFRRPGLTLLAGRNGEGKSTFMRYLCGCQPQKPAAAAYRSAYLPEELAFDNGMSAGQIAAACLGSAKKWFLAGAALTGLDVAKAFGKLSKGNKQKTRNLLALALGRERDVALICLDEAMSGLDYSVRRVFWTIIAEEAALRHVILSLHPDEIYSPPTQIITVRSGRISLMPDPRASWDGIEAWLEAA